MSKADEAPTPFEALRNQAWLQAFKAYGTAHIFERRANIYRTLLRVVSYVALAIPLIIGALYLSFRSQQALLDWFTWIASVLGVIQIAISAWSLIAKWDDVYSYSLESYAHNSTLSERFRVLGEMPPSKLSDFQSQYNILEAENNARTQQDNRQGITPKEKRRGMRAALWRFERKCATCKQQPTSMKPSNCDTCGNF